MILIVDTLYWMSYCELGEVLRTLLLFNPLTALLYRCCYPHLVDEETKAWSGSVTCPRSHLTRK